jgi:hypothetical protein
MYLFAKADRQKKLAGISLFPTDRFACNKKCACRFSEISLFLPRSSW